MEVEYASNATCSAALINKILDQYINNSYLISNELSKKVSSFKISNSIDQVPLELFNEIVDWIEKELGPANLKMIGIIMGEEAFLNLKANNQLSETTSPQEIINKLILVTQILIKDPLQRNWKIIEINENSARVRKTQTFNTTVQIGIIESFIRKAGVVFPRTRLVRDYKRGPAFDEYEITWY